MTGDEMVQAIRDDALDSDAVSWANARVLRVLNRAAKFVGRELARHQIINNVASSENFITVANTRAYALSASNIESIFRVVRLDGVRSDTIQTITLAGYNATDTFSITLDGKTTAELTVAAGPTLPTAAVVKAALLALGNINVVDVALAGNVYTITLKGRWSGKSASTFTTTYTDTGGGGGSATVAETQVGGAGNSREVETIKEIAVEQLFCDGGYGGYGSTWRGSQYLRYYRTRNKTTGAYTINFPRDPSSGITFTVHYVATPATIAAGGSETEYFDIPSKYHDLVIARAVMMVIGPDSSHIGYATAAYAELKNELQNEAGIMSSPGEIAQEF